MLELELQYTIGTAFGCSWTRNIREVAVGRTRK